MATGGEPRDRYSIASDNATETDWCRQCDMRGSKIEWYCENHSAVFCVKCKYTEHRRCNIKSIPEFVKGVEQTPYLIKTKQDLDQVESDVDDMLSYMEDITLRMDDDCISTIDQLRQQRARVNKSFDMLEERIVEELQKYQSEDSLKIHNNKRELNDSQHEIQNLKIKIKNNNIENKSQTLINMTECRSHINKCDKQMRSMTATALPMGYQLIVRKTFHEFLENIKDPETFTIERTITNHPPKEIIPSLELTRKKSYSSKKYKRCFVNDKYDSVICNLYGSCVLPNGTILLTDKNNHTLIRLNRSLKVKDKCKLEHSPSSIACINESEAVIAASGKAIVFVDTQKQLSVTKTLPITHKCSGIAFRSGMLYVSDYPSTINVYSKRSGNILSLIVADHIGLQMFSEIRHIAFSPDGTRMYVADSKKGLVILDSNGRYITTVQYPMLDEAFGVCVGNSGNVYVSGLKSMNVVQIEPTDLTVSEVARMKEEEYPQSICVNETKKLLIVTLCSSNNFKAFDLGH